MFAKKLPSPDPSSNGNLQKLPDRQAARTEMNRVMLIRTKSARSVTRQNGPIVYNLRE